MQVNDTTGRTPKELAGAYSEAGAARPGDVTLAPEDLAVLVMEGGAGFTMVAQPAGATDYGFARPRYDVSVYRGIRVTADVLVAGSAGAVLKAYYQAPGGSTWLPVSNPATAEVSIAATGEVASAAVPLVASCTGDVRFMVKAEGGDAATSPSLRRVAVQLVDVAQRVEDATVAETCEVAPGGFWAEDWSGYADDAALDAAYEAELTPGKFLYGLNYKSGFTTKTRGAFLDPTVTFCGHQTFRGHSGPATEPVQGWSNSTYFGEWTIDLPWPYPAFTDVWTRNTWKFQTPAHDNVVFDLMYHTYEGDGNYEVMLFRLDGGDIKAVHFSQQDGLDTIEETIGAASEIVTGDWVDVIARGRIAGGNMLMDFWWAPHGTTPVHKGTISRPAYPGATKVIWASMGSKMVIEGGADHWNGRSELHDGTVHANPYGVVIP